MLIRKIEKTINQDIQQINSQLEFISAETIQNMFTITKQLSDYRDLVKGLGSNQSYEDFINSTYEKLRNNYRDYITRKEIGIDSSTIPLSIYQYEFKPRNPKIKILLQGGTHGCERTAIFALFEMLKLIADSKNISTFYQLQKLREEVHFVVIPVVCPWAFIKFNYCNERGVNPNRNYAYNWLNQPNATQTPFDVYCKGVSALSENECKAVDSMISNNTDAVIHFDFHSTNGHEYDFYYMTTSDFEAKEICHTVYDYYKIKRANTPDLPPSKGKFIVEEMEVASIRAYSWAKYGVPSITMEWEDTSWGGELNSSKEITIATEWFLNHINQQYLYFINKKKKVVAQAPKLDKGLDVNKTIIQNIEDYLEPLRMANSDYITRENLGKDSSGLYDIWCYKLQPYNFDKTVVIFTGLSGLSVNAPITAMQTINEIIKNKEGKYNELRYHTRILYIPIANPYGNMNKKVTNYNNVNLQFNFDYKWSECSDNQKGTSAFSELETQYIRNIVNKYKADYVYWYDNQRPEAYGVVAPINNQLYYQARATAKLLDENASLYITTENICNPTCYFNLVRKVQSFHIFQNDGYWDTQINSVIQRSKNMEFFIEVMNNIVNSEKFTPNNQTFYNIIHNTKNSLSFGRTEKIIEQYNYTIPAQNSDGYLSINGYIHLIHDGTEGNITNITPIITTNNKNYDLQFHKDKFGIKVSTSGTSSHIIVPFKAVQYFEREKPIYIKFSCFTTQPYLTMLQKLDCNIEIINNCQQSIASNSESFNF